ncbi:MAG: hypothetical protein J7K98_03765 [Candidatus Aenigmarchaeota archaeon]|nr:hypothetical protein [Candidatus Aenigmarchaeota archaeon]
MNPLLIGYGHEEISAKSTTREKSTLPEELAAELISFAKKEFPDKERKIWIRNIVSYFGKVRMWKDLNTLWHNIYLLYSIH